MYACTEREGHRVSEIEPNWVWHVSACVCREVRKGGEEEEGVNLIVKEFCIKKHQRERERGSERRRERRERKGV